MASSTVILHRRQLDGDTASPALALTGPFTRSAPAPSVEAAVATVQQALPKDPVVVPSAPTAVPGPNAAGSGDVDEKTLLLKRMERIMAFHRSETDAQRMLDFVGGRNVERLRDFHAKLAVKYSEDSVPEHFMPLPVSTQPRPAATPSDANECATGITVLPEVRVAAFRRPDKSFSGTLMLPVAVATCHRDPEALASFNAHNRTHNGTTTAVYPAIR